MAKPHPAPLTCGNAACAQPLASAVPYCPFCGQAQPVAANRDKQAPPQVPVARPAHAAAVPPAVPPVVPQAPTRAPPEIARTPLEPPPVPVAVDAVSPHPAPPAAFPRASGSRLPLVVGMLAFGALCAFLLLRGDGKPSQVERTRFGQWRSAAEACLRSGDAQCADAQLANLRGAAPSEYWSDLEQRMLQLRQQQQQQEQRALQAQQRQRELKEQAALAQAAEQARARQAAAAEDAAELAVPTPYVAPAMPDRPARLPEGAQQDPPLQYPREALRNGIGGSVVLNINVDADGTARYVSVFRSSGNRQLDHAAQDAARRWKYEPAIVGGRPSAAVLEKEIVFNPVAAGGERPRTGAAEATPVAPAGQDAALLEKARTELRAGRYDVAVALAESALAINPASRAAHELIEQARDERERVMRETTID